MGCAGSKARATKETKKKGEQTASISLAIRGENFSTRTIDLMVKIKEEYYKELPVPSIKSRLVLATIWSFYGYNTGVSWLMQRLSHKTRAYFFNAKLLKGFLEPCISGFLLNATKEEKDQLTEHHNVDLVVLETVLGKIPKMIDQIAHL